jgi:hypothetical protein
MPDLLRINECPECGCVGYHEPECLTGRLYWLEAASGALRDDIARGSGQFPRRGAEVIRAAKRCEEMISSTHRFAEDVAAFMGRDPICGRCEHPLSDHVRGRCERCFCRSFCPENELQIPRDIVEAMVWHVNEGFMVAHLAAYVPGHDLVVWWNGGATFQLARVGNVLTRRAATPILAAWLDYGDDDRGQADGWGHLSRFDIKGVPWNDEEAYLEFKGQEYTGPVRLFAPQAVSQARAEASGESR